MATKATISRQPSRRLLLTPLLWLLLAPLTLAPARGAEPSGSLTAPGTGVAFSVTRSAPGGAAPLALTGVGVRTLVVFKVYAFGLYVDPEAARRALGQWKGRPAQSLEQDAELRRALVEMAGERLAVMHFVRSVSDKKMRDAMTEAMDRGVPADDPARAAFLSLWRQPIDKDEEVEIAFPADGSVTVIRRGAPVGTVKSVVLARCLLQSWLGPDPVSEDIRRGVTSRIPALLAGP